MKATLAELQLDAPIRPAQGLGGIVIGAPISGIATLLQRSRLQGILDARVVNLFDASYSLPAVEIGVDIRNGKIYRITAKSGYAGTLFGSIRVGMNAGHAMLLVPSLYYDEPREVLLCAGVQGVALELSAIDPDPTDVPGLAITGVSVFTPDVETPLGQMGHW